jgi:hypothetical protein
MEKERLLVFISLELETQDWSDAGREKYQIFFYKIDGGSFGKYLTRERVGLLAASGTSDAVHLRRAFRRNGISLAVVSLPDLTSRTKGALKPS